MPTDHACNLLLQPLRHKQDVQMGEAVLASITHCPLIPRPPNSALEPKLYGDLLHLKGEALPGLFLYPKGEHGFISYLLLSWCMASRDVRPSVHQAALEANEPPGVQWRVHWGVPVKIESVWQVAGRHVRTTAHLKKMAIKAMLTSAAKTPEDAIWMATRLLPRRLPAAWRYITPIHTQIWCSL